jgi:hypothetical protein
MKAISEILGWSSEKHQQHVLNTFFLWCDLNTTSDKEMQAMICNQRMWKWYNAKFSKLELIFYDQIGGQRLNKAALFECYNQATIQVRNYYPPCSILTKIKKQGLPNINNN